MDANGLRAAFTRFFADRGHTIVPSASLIPHDPSVLFTIAGMVPFKPYFVGEEPAPWPRATSIQKCFRTPDIDIIGTDTYHCTFFEMLGNFSFGDYFKAEAIPMAWELLTEVFGLDGDRLWVTVHESDDEAEQIWIDKVGVRPERIQRMGDEDNFWAMGDTGPCGPDSEIFFDKGEAYGHDGGPKHGGSERFVEIWNLVFMQSNRDAAGRPHGAAPQEHRHRRRPGAHPAHSSRGTTPSSTPTCSPRSSTPRPPSSGPPTAADERTDVALAGTGRPRSRRLHAGVRRGPARQRGPGLRAAPGRAPRRDGGPARRGRRAHRPRRWCRPPPRCWARPTRRCWPSATSIVDVVAREEAGFDRTLRAGLGRLEEALATGTKVLGGDVAFTLHDTHGFPVELTEELARDAGVEVDRAGFDAAMAEQRERARSAAKASRAGDEEAYRELLELEGPTPFVGRGLENYEVPARVVAVLEGGGSEGEEGAGPSEDGVVEVFLDRTPFYAESGGQIGDTGTIVTETGTAEVYDTVLAVPGLIAHRARVTGEVRAGQDALARIDGERREAIRRNHTATHLLHSALRTVLGDHVRQQGSLVSPDYLRFDFSHHAQPTRDELDRVFALANDAVLTDVQVQTTETSRDEAEKMGAIAFFGDKYGSSVRVVQAGPTSLEFCGGTHVDSLGQIGPITLLSEGSIGSNTRRIFAADRARVAPARRSSGSAWCSPRRRLLRTEPDELLAAIGRVTERQRDAEKELGRLRQQSSEAEARTLAEQAAADSGVVVARRDNVEPEALRNLAQAVLRHDGVRAVVLGGSPDGAKVAIAAATGGTPDATQLVRTLGQMVGGGGGGSAEVALAGGRDPSQIEAALAEAQRLLSA